MNRTRVTGVLLRFGISALMLVTILVCAGAHSFASVARPMEEPYSTFGAMNPTGHSAVYLNHVFAETPTELRPCRSGEYGTVINRYGGPL